MRVTATNIAHFGAFRRKPSASGSSRWGSIQVGRLGGAPVHVEVGAGLLAVVFIVVLATQGFVRVEPESSLALRLFVATGTVAVFLGSILAHEMGHASMAKRFEVKVLGITLSLFGGHAQLERQAPSPRAEFSIAAAGPAVNLGIGAFLGALVILANQLLANERAFSSGASGRFVVAALFWLAAVNLTLAILNLAPAAPLDGGRLVTAWLWHRSGDAEWARVQAGRLGLGLAAILGIVGIIQTTTGLGGIVTVAVAFFIFQGARREILGATLRRRLAATTAAQVMVAHPPPISDALTLDGLSQLAQAGQQGVALPVQRWGQSPIGYVLASAPEVARPEHSWTTIKPSMHRAHEVARAWSSEPLDEVLRRFSDRQELVVVVHDPRSGQEVGTFSYHQLRNLLKAPDTWGRTRSEVPS